MKTLVFVILSGLEAAIQFDFEVATPNGIVDFRSNETDGSMMFLNSTYYGGCTWTFMNEQTLQELETLLDEKHKQFEVLLPSSVLDRTYVKIFTREKRGLIPAEKQESTLRCNEAKRRSFTTDEERWLETLEKILFPTGSFRFRNFKFTGPLKKGFVEAEQSNYKNGYFRFTEDNELKEHCRWEYLTDSTMKKIKNLKYGRHTPLRFFTDHIERGIDLENQLNDGKKESRKEYHIFSLPTGSNNMNCTLSGDK